MGLWENEKIDGDVSILQFMSLDVVDVFSGSSKNFLLIVCFSNVLCCHASVLLYYTPTSQEQVGKLLTETQQRCGLARSAPELCSNAWIEYFTSLLFPFGHLGSKIVFETSALGFPLCSTRGDGKTRFSLVLTLYIYIYILFLFCFYSTFPSQRCADEGIPLILFVELRLCLDQFFKFSFFCVVLCGSLLSSVGYGKWILRCATLVRRIGKYRFFCSCGSRAATWPAVAVAEG